MRTLLLRLLALGTCAALAPSASAQNPLQTSLQDTDIAPHWIYDDLPRAIVQAKAENKPILAVFRCVPCPPGRTLDRQLMKPDAELEKFQKNFVCVRVVQAKGLDLKRYQFDYDQSWCVMFLNADGTIYGRYGTRTTSGPKSDAHLTLPSWRKAAERALELHRGYPGNKALLEGKTAKSADYRVPEEIPGLTDRANVATTKQNCIHCHMVRENILRTKWLEGKLTLDDLWVYPMPDRIGLSMDVEDGLRVQAVTAGSPAAKAGLAAGDELVTLAGQQLISTADIQWALHTSPNETTLPATLRRGGQLREATIALSGNWKESDLAWRASSWFALRHGLATAPLSAADKKKRGIEDEGLALVVKGLFGKGAAPLQKAGLRAGDVIVAIDGKSTNLTESQFLIYLRLQHGPRDNVKLTVLRGENRMELTVPMW